MSNYLPKSYTDEIFKALLKAIEEKHPPHVLKYQKNRDLKEEIRKPFTLTVKKELEKRISEITDIDKKGNITHKLNNERNTAIFKLRNDKDNIVALFETKNLFKNDSYKKTISYALCNPLGLKYWLAPISYQSDNNPPVENSDIENDIKFLTLYFFFERKHLLNKFESHREAMIDFVLTIPSSDFSSLIIDSLIDFFTKGLNGFNPQRQLLFDLKNLKNKNSEISTQHPNIDLSNALDVNKIRYLIELGIIDNLNDNGFTHSTNSLSSVISGITGINITTVQPYLNAYLKNKSSRNNPMNVIDEVEKIRNTLNQLGYKKT